MCLRREVQLAILARVGIFTTCKGVAFAEVLLVGPKVGGRVAAVRFVALVLGVVSLPSVAGREAVSIAQRFNHF